MKSAVSSACYSMTGRQARRTVLAADNKHCGERVSRRFTLALRYGHLAELKLASAGLGN